MALNFLIYCDDHGVGGAAAATHRLALGLAGRGHAVRYAQSRNDSPAVMERERAGVGHNFIPYDTIRYFWPSVTDTRNPARLFLDARPDVAVFSDSMTESSLGAKEAAALLDIPYVVVKHLVIPNGLYAHRADVGDRVGRALAGAAATVTVSDQNRAVLLARYPALADRVVTVRNSAPDRFFAPTDPARRAAFRARHAVPDDALAVLTVAAVAPRKGLHHQIRMMEALKAAGVLDRFVFLWAGGEEDEQYAGSLRAALAATGCADRVRLLGRQDDVPLCLDGCDVLLLSSEQEGMPLVTLEAMAKARPVVCTAVGGAPEILTPGTGLMVPDPVADPDGAVIGMARALIALQADAPGRARLAAAGQDRVRAGFSDKSMLDRYEEILLRAAYAPGDRIPAGLTLLGTGWTLPHVKPATARDAPEGRYADVRFPRMAGISATRDEALILYNAALRLPGRRALEVGLSFGWIARHLLAAGMHVDVADPFLAHPEVRAAAVAAADDPAAGQGRALVGGAELLSPAPNPAERWSLIYLDAERSGQGAEEAIRRCVWAAAQEALIFVQNRAAPGVEPALAALTAAGWRRRDYPTAGKLTAVWRGATEPPDAGAL